MLNNFHPNPTQALGLLMFALAFSATTWAAARQPRGPYRTWWLLLASLHLACWSEMLFEGRYRLHEAVNAVLKAQGWYWERQSLQVNLIMGTLILLTMALAAVVVRNKATAELGVNGVLAAAGTLVALTLFAVECVSLHVLDAIMYTHAGPFMVIGWLWAAATALVVVAAIRAAFHARQR
jgi:hypothetical protein